MINLGFDVFVKPYNNLICLGLLASLLNLLGGVNVHKPSLYRVGYILNRFDMYIFDMISSALFEASISSKRFRLFTHSSFSHSYDLRTPYSNLNGSPLIHDDVDKLSQSIQVEFSQPSVYSNEYLSWQFFIAYHTGYDQSFDSVKNKWSNLLSRFLV